ncbi:Zinc-binding protein A33 [Labeo rohita]|uniref:Zinc-binding protein A33 n=1 Tax=Labeo rohita TaxID=84645 RepID=A0ABQ8L426_LABRO|nr:Zinc-binding protein A33 [Labeo rohita]
MEEQQKAAEKQAEDLIKMLQQEITGLWSRNTELEQLSHTDDHLHLIQIFSSLCSRPLTKNWTGISINSDQGFSYGKFYYEVQVKGKTEWDLGVASESINRKEMTTLTPVNGFWTLILRNDNEYDACENPSVSFSLKVKPEKVGVFVDYEEGLVSFYDVGSSSHIYSFTGQTFTEKLYPYFSPGLNDECKNSNPLIITPSGVHMQSAAGSQANSKVLFRSSLSDPAPRFLPRRSPPVCATRSRSSVRRSVHSTDHI